MKVALAPGADLIRRVGRVLLADRRVELVGVHHAPGSDPRVVTIDDLGEFDIVVAEEMGGREVDAAWQLRIPIVIADQLMTPDTRSLVTDGADVAGLAGALGGLASRAAGAQHAQVAWTVSGRALRSGRLVEFPSPVGPLYGEEQDGTIIAPTPGEHAAISIAAEGTAGSLIYGVVDHSAFLGAVCLAAAALARGDSPGGPAEQLGDSFVSEVIQAGITVASRIL